MLLIVIPAVAFIGYGSWILSQLSDAADAVGLDDLADALDKAADKTDNWNVNNITDSVSDAMGDLSDKINDILGGDTSQPVSEGNYTDIIPAGNSTDITGNMTDILSNVTDTLNDLDSMVSGL